MEEIRSFNQAVEGMPLTSLTKAPVTHLQLVRYAGASGDFNPLHIDPESGKAIGIGQIAHGMLIMGFVGQAVTGWIPKKYLRKLDARFVGMTHPGDIVTVSGVITGKKTEINRHRVFGDVSAKNQNGDLLVTGSFMADLPELDP